MGDVLLEEDIEEWLNLLSKYPSTQKSVVYYPDGVIRKFEGSIFDRLNLGESQFSDYCGWVIIAEKSEDGKRIWLEKG